MTVKNYQDMPSSVLVCVFLTRGMQLSTIAFYCTKPANPLGGGGHGGYPHLMATCIYICVCDTVKEQVLPNMYSYCSVWLQLF